MYIIKHNCILVFFRLCKIPSENDRMLTKLSIRHMAADDGGKMADMCTWSITFYVDSRTVHVHGL